LALTKHCRRQNIGSDKNVRAHRIYWRRQNIGANKIFASTKYSPRQNIGVEKILVLTKFLRRQNTRVNKMLAQTQKDPLTVWLGESTATDFSQT
jgi:hypothetical protein